MMKKIVPFKKEMEFKTNVSEITSISLEHNLSIKNNNLISGHFIISGEYKIADTSINTEIFNFEVPFDISVDEKYKLDNVIVDIDDFYYEIVNNKLLEVNIDVLIDKLVESPLIEEINDYNMIDNSLNQPSTNNSDSESNNRENAIELAIDGENNSNMKEEELEIMERCIEPEDILNEVDEENNKIDDDFKDFVKPIELVEPKEVKSIEKINSLFDNLDASTETYKAYKVCIIRTGDTIESILQKYSISKEELEKYNNLSDIKIGDKLIIPSINDAKV